MITTDKELDEKLELLGRLYRATRHEFSALTITEANAAKLVRSTGKITTAITATLSDIEDYTGAGEIRRLTAAMQDIHRSKTMKPSEDSSNG